MLYYVKSLTLLKFEYKVEIYLNMKLFLFCWTHNQSYKVVYRYILQTACLVI